MKKKKRRAAENQAKKYDNSQIQGRHYLDSK